MPAKPPKRKMILLKLEPERADALKRLSEATRVPVAAYMREAVDDLLAKYAKVLKGAKR